MARLWCCAMTMAMVMAAVAAEAGPKDEALQVVDRWAKAFTSSDVDGIVGLYAPDALFLGTGSRTVVTDLADVRRYFERALLTGRPVTATVHQYSVAEVSDTVVVVTGLDSTTRTREGSVATSNGRFTFVVANRGRGWQIVHFHRSSVPG